MESNRKNKQVTFNLRVDPVLKAAYWGAVTELAASGFRGSGGGPVNPSEVVDWLMAWVAEGDRASRAARLRAMRRSFFLRNAACEERLIPPSAPLPLEGPSAGQETGSDGVGPVAGRGHVIHHVTAASATPDEVPESIRRQSAGRADRDKMRPHAKGGPKGSVN